MPANLMLTADPGHAGSDCARCKEPAYPGYYFVGDPDAEAPLPFLCAACSRTDAPALTVCAQALNMLCGWANDLTEQQRDAVARQLDDLAEQIREGHVQGW